MHHDIDVLDGISEIILVKKITLDQLYARQRMRDVSPVDIAPVKDPHAVSALQQCVHDVRSDESPTAKNQAQHRYHYPQSHKQSCIAPRWPKELHSRYS